MRTIQEIARAQDELRVLNKEENESTVESSSSSSADRQDEACSFCRSLDFDLIFAFTFALFVSLMLILIMILWLNGVYQYQE